MYILSSDSKYVLRIGDDKLVKWLLVETEEMTVRIEWQKAFMQNLQEFGWGVNISKYTYRRPEYSFTVGYEPNATKYKYSALDLLHM